MTLLPSGMAATASAGLTTFISFSSSEPGSQTSPPSCRVPPLHRLPMERGPSGEVGSYYASPVHTSDRKVGCGIGALEFRRAGEVPGPDLQGRHLAVADDRGLQLRRRADRLDV